MNLNKKGNKCWAKSQDTIYELLKPFDKAEYLENVQVARGETVYEMLSPTVSELHPCTAVLKAISHLVIGEPNGFACYKDNGWITQYRFPDTCITTLTTNDVTLSYTNRNGVISNTNFDDVPDAWFYHVLVGIYYGLLDEGNYTNVNIKRKIEKLITSYGNGTFEKDFPSKKHIVVFTNDVYAHCLMKGYDYGDFPLLSKSSVHIDMKDVTSIDGRVDLSVLTGGSAALSSSKNKTLKNLLGKYTIGDSTNTSDKYDKFVVCQEVEQVCKILKANALKKTSIPQNFLFTGIAGTGKSSAAYMIARACNLNYSFVVGSENLTMDELLVNTTLGEKPGEVIKVESPLVKAFREGGVIEFQEANCIKRPNVIQFLNPLLDDNGELQLSTGEKLVRHPNTVIIFTANVGYEGTKGMNQALLSRCSAKFEFELPNDTVLAKRLVDRSGISKENAEKMVKVMHSINKVLEESGYSDGCCSYREVENWAKMSMMFGNIYDSALFTVVNSATNDVDGRAEVTEAILTQFDKTDCVDNMIELA